MLKVGDIDILEILIKVVFYHENWEESKVLYIEKEDFFKDVDEHMFTENLLPSQQHNHIERYLGFNI